MQQLETPTTQIHKLHKRSQGTDKGFSLQQYARGQKAKSITQEKKKSTLFQRNKVVITILIDTTEMSHQLTVPCMLPAAVI